MEVFEKVRDWFAFTARKSRECMCEQAAVYQAMHQMLDFLDDEIWISRLDERGVLHKFYSLYKESYVHHPYVFYSRFASIPQGDLKENLIVLDEGEVYLHPSGKRNCCISC